MREKNIERKIRKYLEARGWYVHKVYQDEKSSGFPDLIALKGERFLLIETKAPTGRLRGTQKYVHYKLKKAGVKVIIAKDIKDIEEAL